MEMELSSYTIVVVFVLVIETSGQMDENTVDLQQIVAPLHVQVKTTNESLLFDRLLNGHANNEGRVTSFLELLRKTNTQASLSNDCQSDTSLLVNDSSVFFKYVDATAKVPFGILQGKWNWVGDYQECYGIESVYNPTTGKSFKGRYSTAVLLLNGKRIFNSTTIMFGACLPESCDKNDSKTLLNEVIFFIKVAAAKIYPDIAKEDLYVHEVFLDRQQNLDGGATAVIVVTGLLGAIVLFATAVDYGGKLFEKESSNSVAHTRFDVSFEETNDTTELLAVANIQTNRSDFKRKLVNICRVFSITSNGKKLFGTETAVGPLACLNGIRVLSIWWVVLGHTYFIAISAVDNIYEADKLRQRFTFQPILNGTYSVDSFFFLSGLLVAYLALKQIREKGKLSWPYYFLHRYWRLTPLYAYVIFYFTFISKYTLTGPISFFTEQPQYKAMIDVCKKYWWTNLLYVNNMYPHYGNIRTTCMEWTWYLASDMQFYLVLGPILILTFSLRGRRYYMIGVAIAVILILAGIIVRGILVWYFGTYSLDGPATKHLDNPWAKNNPLYDKPYTRWSVYLVGMLTGYVLATTNNRIRIHRVIAAVGWCVAIATALAVIYGPYYYNKHPGTHMTLVQSGFYVALGRTAWSLCLSWVVIACVSGNGGPVKDILSWPIWAPLGRLTYAAYLVHPIVIITYYTSVRRPLHFSDLTMVYLFISNLVVSYVIAFIVSMLVEAPMIQLEKLVLPSLSSFSTKCVTGPTMALVGKLRSLCGRS